MTYFLLYLWERSKICRIIILCIATPFAYKSEHHSTQPILIFNRKNPQIFKSLNGISIYFNSFVRESAAQKGKKDKIFIKNNAFFRFLIEVKSYSISRSSFGYMCTPDI